MDGNYLTSTSRGRREDALGRPVGRAGSKEKRYLLSLLSSKVAARREINVFV